MRCSAECVLCRRGVWQLRADAPERQLIRPRRLLHMVWDMLHSQSFCSGCHQHRQALARACPTDLSIASRSIQLTQSLCSCGAYQGGSGHVHVHFLQGTLVFLLGMHVVRGDALQDMLESILPPDAQRAAKSRPLLPGTLLLVSKECVWASPALVLSARHSAVRAAATHAALMSCVLEASGTCATPSVLQLSYTRYINPQVAQLCL